MDDLRRAQYVRHPSPSSSITAALNSSAVSSHCQAQGARAQRSHIRLALPAFVRLESHCFHTGISWFAAKNKIIREAVRAFIARPKLIQLYHGWQSKLIQLFQIDTNTFVQLNQ